ncbi:MAG TPA: cob(I)yrinic acid a,c-diamide adenosyltransferase [Bacteroidales bacterium]|nr:cob(I)yrinic acid a,c-diamide adenosyltransferase [Bacteroidales bacterium]
MKIYTRTGDDGTTSLAGGRRVPKHSIRVEAYGSVEELIAWVGLLKDHQENIGRFDDLVYIQNQLMNCAAVLSGDGKNSNSKLILPDTGCVSFIEKKIDSMEKALPSLKNFILPGGNKLISYCHIARCVCRRAERAVSRLKEAEGSPEIVSIFLNRLSDYLFVLSRKIGLELDVEEDRWSV